MNSDELYSDADPTAGGSGSQARLVREKVVVSGASGFVGAALIRSLASSGHPVTGLGRKELADSVTTACAGADDSSLSGLLAGAGLFVHLAARTHSADLRDPRAAAIYRRTNIDLTMRLATACSRAGVRRFIFLSSVKACGERTRENPMRELDTPAPEDLYGITKLEAEDRLLELATGCSMEIVILRSPLVYGPGVKANFLKLMQLVRSGVPLPFGAVRNRRSLIGLHNLVEAIEQCGRAPMSLTGRYFVSDGRDLSTRELVELICAALRRKPRLLSISPRLLAGAGAMFGMSGLIERLVGDLRVDASLLSSLLGWRPGYSVEEQIQDTADWFVRTHCNGSEES